MGKSKYKITLYLRFIPLSLNLRFSLLLSIHFFFHPIEEILQKKTAQAVHMLAGDIGLPEWLVNIRHEATHYTLPSMDLLRNGVSVAFEWLKVRRRWGKKARMHANTYIHAHTYTNHL